MPVRALDRARAILATETVTRREGDPNLRRYIRARVPVNRRYTVLEAHRPDREAEYVTLSRPLWDALQAALAEEEHDA